MSLRDTVKSGIAIANKLTKPLQATVLHWSFVSESVDGTPVFLTASPVSRTALVEMKQFQVKTSTGEVVAARAKVTFLSPIVVNTRDQIILPDGSTGPILAVTGLADPITGVPYMPEVFLG